MPAVAIKHIVSFSSEDNIHKAENLLKENTHGKWKCCKQGEPQASVVFQLEKATRISSLDIGNEGSAFIEVLVSRSSEKEDYQVLLVASSFMTPHESRSGNGASKVRMFNQDQLSPEISKQLWDRVKIVCTQPFNKRVTYGLTFVNLYTKEKESTSSDTKPSIKQEASQEERTSFGKFKLKPASSEISPPTARMLKPEKLANIKTEATKPKKIEVDDNSNRENIEKKLENLKRKQAAVTPVKAKVAKIEPKSAAKAKPSKKSPTKPEPAKKIIKKAVRPFHRLMKDVVFTISGFQNPKRSEIRDAGLSMGAQYRKDWGTGCTHLVCAFANTPKFRQVMGEPRGRIVRSDWLLDSAAQKARLPWRRYNMDPNLSNDGSDTEDENEEEVQADDSPSSRDDPYDVSTDEDNDVIDTDDELDRLNLKTEDDVKPAATDDVIDPYDVSTDEEEEIPQTSGQGRDSIPQLPEYFKGKTFLLYGSFLPDVERLLKRHIITCNGQLKDYMGDDVTHVVTQQMWDANFDDALADNSSVVFVRPQWVFECGKSKSLLPHSRFAVHPA